MPEGLRPPGSLARAGWSARRRPPGRGRRRCRAARRGPPRPRSASPRGPPRAARGPSARWAASADEWVQPEPCAAPSGWRSPGIRSNASPSKNRSVASSRWPPVTTTLAGPRACRRRASALEVVVGAGQRRGASGTFGVITVDERQQLADDRLAGGLVEQHGARLGDHHGVEHDRGAGLEQRERLAHGAHGLGGAEHADLDRVDADVLGDGADLLDDERRRAPGGCR